LVADESEDSSSEDESVDVPVAARRKFDDEEDSDDVCLLQAPFP